MGKKRKPSIVDSILLFLLAVGAILAAVFGFLIALVIQHGGTDNLTVEWAFLFVGVGMCILGGVGKLLQSRKAR